MKSKRWVLLNSVNVPLLALCLIALEGVSSGQSRNPFLGSVPDGKATETTLDLPLQDAFHRALKYNLGEIESSENTRAAHALRLRSLNALLPTLIARVSAAVEQVDLPAQGFSLKIPGFAIPTVVGPFGVADARGYLSQEIFNWSDIKNWKAAAEGRRPRSTTSRAIVTWSCTPPAMPICW